VSVVWTGYDDIDRSLSHTLFHFVISHVVKVTFRNLVTGVARRPIRPSVCDVDLMGHASDRCRQMTVRLDTLADMNCSFVDFARKMHHRTVRR